MNNSEVFYCRKCVLPSTKPDLSFNENGVCHACQNYDARTHVDWEARKAELLEILERYRSTDGTKHDCIIPVSGGKDSHYQAIKMLEFGMNPLAVTFETCKLSEIGRRNIENIKKLGIDHIEVSPDPIVRRKINRMGLEQVGDLCWPEHVGIFTVPIRLAVQWNVPLIIWGENSQNEYGGPAAAAENNVLDRSWLEEFGGLLGMRVSDLVGQDGIEKRDLIMYTYPSDEELARIGVTGLFLGHYLPWDGHHNALIAQGYGFETYPHVVEGNIVSYENLDNIFMRIHDYFKFLKYGYDRASDWASVHIRRDRFSREEGFRLAERYGGKFPSEYLGVALEECLLELNLTRDEFIGICDRFTNKKIFKCDTRGNLIKDKYGNLQKNFS